MSRTLTLIDAGWESVRATADRGQRADALGRLTRLLARPDVPAAQVAEGHRFAGELALGLGRYATARRHLRATAAMEPTLAGTHYLAGRAWEEDPDGCDRKAAIRYRAAAKLDPANPLYRAAFGRAAARCGKVKFGCHAMLSAAEQAPGDAAVIRVAVNGLLEVGQAASARQVLLTARFLCPANAELAALWERVRFETARQAQRKTKTHANTRYAQDAQFATDGDRVTLPFVALAHDTHPSSGGEGGTVRKDTASFPRPYLARPRRARPTGKRESTVQGRTATGGRQDAVSRDHARRRTRPGVIIFCTSKNQSFIRRLRR